MATFGAVAAVALEQLAAMAATEQQTAEMVCNHQSQEQLLITPAVAAVALLMTADWAALAAVEEATRHSAEI